jgi:ribokinase
MVGLVGDDADGRWLVGLLEAEGVETTHVGAIAGASTGTALITVDADGANTIVVAAGANALLAPEAVDAALATPLLPSRSVDVVLVQLEIPTPAVLRALQVAREAGATTILNPAPPAGLPAELLDLVDVLVPNEHEAAVTGLGAHHTVVTLGPAGARWHRSPHDPEPIDVPAFPVTPVDTTGAGDAFCGTLAAALAGGEHLADALRRASAAGAISVTRPGAAPSLPTAAEVDELLQAEVGG